MTDNKVWIALLTPHSETHLNTSFYLFLFIKAQKHAIPKAGAATSALLWEVSLNLL